MPVAKNITFSRNASYVRFGPRSWIDLDVNKKRGFHLLPESSGVYEVWIGGVQVDDAICLYVGSTSNLFKRVRNGLLRGTIDHSHRDDILNVGGKQNTHLLSIMWSESECYKLVEAHLHELYQPKFPDKDLVNAWGLDLSYRGQPWQNVVSWLRSRGILTF